MGYPKFARREGERSTEISIMTEPVPKDPEIRKETPQVVKTLAAKNITEGPKVHKKTPQIDYYTA